MYYLYRHIRPDQGCPFYIGRGKMYERTAYPRRAYTEDRRNPLWKGIVARNGGRFEVEILYWTPSREEILAKEIEFVALYGKIIDGTGTLVNLTDGGDGSLGLRHSPETRAKLSARWQINDDRKAWLRSEEFQAKRRERMRGKPSSMLGRTHRPETLEGFHQSRSGSGNVNARTVIDTATGMVYGCVGDAAHAFGLGKWALYRRLRGERANRTSLRYADGV